MSYELKDVEIGIIGGTGADVELENAKSLQSLYPLWGAFR